MIAQCRRLLGPGRPIERRVAASRILLVRTDVGLAVKLADEREDGSRLLVCDNHTWRPYPDDEDVFGQIVRSGRVILAPASD